MFRNITIRDMLPVIFALTVFAVALFAAGLFGYQTTLQYLRANNERIGYAAITLAGSITIIGLPRQAWSNLKRRSTDGISMALVVCAILSYSVFTLFGLGKEPMIWQLFVYAPGALFGLVILAQAWIYRAKEARRS